MDANLRFSYLSGAYERLSGVGPGFILGKTRKELLDPEKLKQPKWQQHLADLQAHRAFKDFEYEYKKPTGDLLYVQIRGVPVFHRDGKFQGYRGTATDITNRVTAQRNLDDSTEKLSHAIRLIKLGYYVWDGIAKKTISCTEELADIHGVSAQEYIATTDSLDALLNWVHPDDREHYLNSTANAVKNKVSTLKLDYRITTRQGHVRYVREVFDPVYNGKGELLQTTGAMQDITELKLVEQALKDAERLASLGNWRWSVDDNRLVSCSEGYARLIGVPMTEVLEYVNRGDLNLVHKEDVEHFTGVWQNAMHNGQDYQVQYRLKQPDGSFCDIEEIGEVIFTKDGEYHEIRGTIQDITERKIVEKEMSLARSEAEQANQAKSEFLSSMSHELRTPLNAILGFSEIMKVKEPLTASQSKAVNHIIKGGKHLLQLITQVLDFAKIETGQIDLSIEPLDLHYAISDCISVAESLAEKRAINVIDKISDKSLPPVLADLTRFKQVLLNLISNGIKYNQEGGILTIEAEEVPGNIIRISVTDTGSGIVQKKHDQVFEAFDRLGRESLGIEGTGIGLTISKQLVELMGGRIGFQSEENTGSTFWFELPLADPKESPVADPESPRGNLLLDSPLNKTCEQNLILYIEDNPANTLLMQTIFENIPNNYLITAEDAENGLELTSINKPDIILMDIQLPGIDGIEALHRLKENQSTQDIPVIAITASALTSDIQKAQKEDFYAYLTKPINIERMLSVIQEAIEFTKV